MREFYKLITSLLFIIFSQNQISFGYNLTMSSLWSRATAPASSAVFSSAFHALSYIPGLSNVAAVVNKVNPIRIVLNLPVVSSVVPTAISNFFDFGGNVNETKPSKAGLIAAIENYVPDVGLISSDPNLIRFVLFSRQNGPDAPEILEFKNVNSIRKSKYNISKAVKFLVHGFQQNINSSYPQNAKNAYLSTYPDYNIIVVDWGRLAIPNAPYLAPVFYPFAVGNVWKTGVRLGEFISWMHNASLIDPDLVHIIGFSLGSHAAGKAGAVVQEKTGKSVARVTALDPAGPEFYTGVFARKITAKDGQYVDALHTNAGQLGIFVNVAQADFYLNGGSGPQPGCIAFENLVKAVQSVAGLVSGTCSHNAATEFFAKTILLGRDFVSCSCDSLAKYKLGTCGCNGFVTFGEHSRAGTTGTHYVNFRNS